MPQADADDSVRAIVLTGAGRGFCAGADMERLSAAVSGAADLKPGASYPTEGLAANFAQSCSYILGLSKPVIAGINGPVAGIGLVITLFCDIRYMAAGAKLTTAFARRGLIAEHGISWMLPRLIGPMNAMDLLLSARAVTAEEADDLGLVRVLPAEGFAETVQARAAEIANLSSPRSTRIIKRQVYEALFQSLADAISHCLPRAGGQRPHRGLPRGRGALGREAGAAVHGAVTGYGVRPLASAVGAYLQRSREGSDPVRHLAAQVGSKNQRWARGVCPRLAVTPNPGPRRNRASSHGGRGRSRAASRGPIGACARAAPAA